jgi:sugar-specific transcriptional regulator TrmB
MSLERIFKTLVSLGLSQTDARVYVFLALKGPEKALSIVKNLKISKQQIYLSLKHLQYKGIIVSDSESKNSFTALPFEEALGSLIKKEKEQNKMVQKTLLSTWKIMIKNNSETQI